MKLQILGGVMCSLLLLFPACSVDEGDGIEPEGITFVFSDLLNIRGYSAQQTLDGGYVVIGFRQTTTVQAMVLIKMDQNGELLWKRDFEGRYTIPSPGTIKGGWCVQQNQDGGYILLGTQFDKSNLNFLNLSHIIRTDQLGTPIWEQKITPLIQYVRNTSDNGFIVLGTSKRHDGGQGNILFLEKMDGAGSKEWIKYYSGVKTVKGKMVQQTKDGGYILLGTAGNWEEYEIYVVKVNASGTEEWITTLGNTKRPVEGIAIQQTSDGGYIVLGYSQDTPEKRGGNYVFKLDNTGSVVWENTSSSFAPGIQETPDGGYIMVIDAYWSHPDLLKMDRTGKVLWEKPIELDPPPFWIMNFDDIQNTSDGGYLISGMVGDHLLLVKTDKNGYCRGNLKYLP